MERLTEQEKARLDQLEELEKQQPLTDQERAELDGLSERDKANNKLSKGGPTVRV